MSLKTILGTDLVKDSRADINDNFTFLDNKIDNLDAEPAGVNGQIQFNDSGVFGGSRLEYLTSGDGGVNSFLDIKSENGRTLRLIASNTGGVGMYTASEINQFHYSESITEFFTNNGDFIVGSNRDIVFSSRNLDLSKYGTNGVNSSLTVRSRNGSALFQLFANQEVNINGMYSPLKMGLESDAGIYSFWNPAFGGGYAELDTSQIVDSSKTFTFPNATGTVGTVITKETTGDPSETIEGLFAINTEDNNFKVYADGGWRTLTTW